MMRWFWIEGRFSWPFVAAIVFLSLVLVVADFIWRVLVVPAETLVALAVVACVAAALLFVVVMRFLRRTSAP
jgi:ABC-type Fe3+-siderophore transport system permease subunit